MSNIGNIFKQGKSTGRQILHLKFEDSTGRKACSEDGYAYGTVIHELGHTLGTYFVRQIMNSIGRLQLQEYKMIATSSFVFMK